MDSGEYRIESLERRVRHLERRLAKLEVGPPSETGNEAPVETRALPLPPVPPPVRAPSREPAPATSPPPAFVRSAPFVPPVVAAFVPPVIPPPTQGLSVPVEPPVTVSPSGEWSTTAARTPISLKDLEERFAGRALAWIGGIALVAAAIFFLSLAFSRGSPSA
jgi:hypothetical protein